jgi:hypothetical protein
MVREKDAEAEKKRAMTQRASHGPGSVARVYYLFELGCRTVDLRQMSLPLVLRMSGATLYTTGGGER